MCDKTIITLSNEVFNIGRYMRTIKEEIKEVFMVITLLHFTRSGKISILSRL